MKLYNMSAELKAIRSITTRSSKYAEVRSYLLSNFDESFFHYEPTNAAFTRLRTMAQKKGRILTFDELCDDPALAEDVREALRDSKKTYVKSTEDAASLFNILDKFRKTRILFQLSKDIVNRLNTEAVDVDVVLDEVSDEITTARSKEPITDVMFNTGKNGNARDLMKIALSVEDDILMPTGFGEFDERTGGFPSQGVVILAATTSGGKSTVLMNLLDNMFRINEVNVCNISLEMNERKITRRWAAMRTGIPFWKFTKRALNKAERKLANKAWQEHCDFGEEKDLMFSFVTPKSNVTCQQVLSLVRPYAFKIIGIDYIGLLDGTDSDDQWRKLSAIARECKIFSEQNNCLIVLLAQLDSDTDKIRYSKGIVEHADNVWTWNYTDPKQRDLQLIPVVQLKARDAELYDFELVEQFSIMRVTSSATGAGPSGDKGDPLNDGADEEQSVA